MLPTKGNSQFPVRSMIIPAKTGEMIAARADPEFMKPLAKPENFGAISMGIAHIGATVNSAKKKARLKKMAAEVKLCSRMIGIIITSEQRNPKTTRLRRAFLRSPVFSKMRSLTTPPRTSPNTPPRKTPAANSAELLRRNL